MNCRWRGPDQRLSALPQRQTGSRPQVVAFVQRGMRFLLSVWLFYPPKIHSSRVSTLSARSGGSTRPQSSRGYTSSCQAMKKARLAPGFGSVGRREADDPAGSAGIYASAWPGSRRRAAGPSRARPQKKKGSAEAEPFSTSSLWRGDRLTRCARAGRCPAGCRRCRSRRRTLHPSARGRR